MRRRKPNRIKGFDYKFGSFFITICAQKKFELFGEIKSGKMKLSEIGEIVERKISQIEIVYENVFVGCYVVMPNHVHMILSLVYTDAECSNPNVSQIINQFKRAVSIEATFSPWQKSFHDTVIQDENKYNNIIKYISKNIETWEQDELYIRNC
ncbi:MAG: hypothetical protein FWE01_01745 [Firmicutes bacterium]|nr:hypothetical protein [Bacillota bacterium]